MTETASESREDGTIQRHDSNDAQSEDTQESSSMAQNTSQTSTAESQPATAGSYNMSKWGMIKAFLFRIIITYVIFNFFRKPQQPQQNNKSAGGNTAAYGPSTNIFMKGEVIDLLVYINGDAKHSNFTDDGIAKWSVEGLKYGDWEGGPNKDGSYIFEKTFATPETNEYFPIFFLNDYWNLHEEYFPVNETTPELTVRLTYSPMSLFKWQLYAAQSMRNNWYSQLMNMGSKLGSEGDKEEKDITTSMEEEHEQDVLKIDWQHRNSFGLPTIQLDYERSYVESDTKKYDQMAFRYLSWVLFPMLIGYCIYSLVYLEHRGWYSWVLSMLYGFLLTFGFITMTPQLFINYKMKSVAHLPWRMLTYKALNTFIDDLFAFIIRAPTLYRIGCLRDDVIFFIYLYQRWIYPIDPKRMNEFGVSKDMLDKKNDKELPEDSENKEQIEGKKEEDSSPTLAKEILNESDTQVKKRK